MGTDPHVTGDFFFTEEVFARAFRFVIVAATTATSGKAARSISWMVVRGEGI